MSSTTFNLDTTLQVLSMNIYNLKDNYQASDISNQIIILGNIITDLNNKVERVLNLYTIINDLKQRVNTN